MVALFSFLLVCRRLMGNSYENVGRFCKSPGGRFYQIVLQVFIPPFGKLRSGLVSVPFMGNPFENGS